MRSVVLAVVALLVSLMLGPIVLADDPPTVQVVITNPDGSTTTLSCVSGFASPTLQQLQTAGMDANVTISTWSSSGIAAGQNMQNYSCNAPAN